MKINGYDSPDYPLQMVLELACAAQRYNNGYIKTIEAVFDTVDQKAMYYKHPNRTLMEVVLNPSQTKYAAGMAPPLITTNLDDKELAEDIKKHFRKLMFAAIEGEQDFETTLNQILTTGKVPMNRLGYIACLPAYYKRDYAKTMFERRIKTLEEGYLGELGQELHDLDCEILVSKHSNNYDAFNIEAIIDNKLVSWMGKSDLKLGPCVVIKAKVKAFNTHWKYQVPVTRLNYVKAFQ